MSGHNKWSQIKHKKGASDAMKSKVWGKLAKRIIVESKIAGGDVTSPTLRTWIEKAKAANMPKDNIDRAVKKGISNDAGAMDSVVYETYGPGGAAILIEALTDNRNRTAPEIKHLLSERGLELASPGSAAWAFQKTNDGYEAKTTVPLSEADTEELMKILEAIDAHDDVEDVYTNAA
ncbi:YebC/PmpR family DNA-binding transcriptional regulator [Candidatus Kaiserbacteria bacterium]|nr:YebC/PmpR family DNA-binding transcriptional regulator [Candidatus Kaiserbacteria bacterium]